MGNRMSGQPRALAFAGVSHSLSTDPHKYGNVFWSQAGGYSLSPRMGGEGIVADLRGRRRERQRGSGSRVHTCIACEIGRRDTLERIARIVLPSKVLARLAKADRRKAVLVTLRASASRTNRPRLAIL